MSRSYRVFIAALVGLAIFNPIGENCRAQDGATDSQRKPKHDAKPIDLSPVQNALDGLTSAVKALGDNPEADTEKKRADRDLKAQEDMAKWAFYLFWATISSLALTAFGIFLIWRTLVHTRRAADASVDMVKEARATTNAAKASLLASSETAERQLRAYITFTDGTAVLIGTDKLLIALRFTNSGQTPAYTIRAHGRAIVGRANEPPTFEMADLDDSLGDMSVIGNNQQHTINMTMSVTQDDLNRLRHHVFWGYAWGELTYTDAFRQLRFFRFRCVTGVRLPHNDPDIMGPADKWRMLVHAKGCDAD